MAITIYTGARKGSILALTWDWAHWKTGMIDLQEPDKPITGKRRSIVPMTKALRREMEAAQANANGSYVVQWHGKAVPTGLRWSFAKACERAGLSWKPTPHHLKHSVASWFAMDRVPIHQAADWLATDPTALRRVYRTFDPTYLGTSLMILNCSGPYGPNQPVDNYAKLLASHRGFEPLLPP